jgi:hypothetical protein
VPDYKAGPKRLLIVLGFFIAGLILALVYVLTAQAWSVVSTLPEYRARIESLSRTMGMRVHHS